MMVSYFLIVISTRINVKKYMCRLDINKKDDLPLIVHAKSSIMQSTIAPELKNKMVNGIVQLNRVLIFVVSPETQKKIFPMFTRPLHATSTTSKE